MSQGLILSNDVLNTVRTNLWKSDRPMHTATVFWKCVFLVARKRSMDVGLKEFLKQEPTLTRL